jgi:DNA mismatch repair protein MutS2
VRNQELDWPELLKNLSSHASSQRGRNLCLEIDALPSAAVAKTKAENIIYALETSKDQHLPNLEILDQINIAFERLNLKAVLDVKELMILRQFLNASLAIKELMWATKNRWTGSIVTQIADFKSQLSAINHVISLDGEINEDASPLLASLCEERRRLSREISRTLDQIVQRRKMEPLLQDKYVTNREGRMVIPVKSGSQHDVKGLIHDASQTKQTVFMEPEEVVPINNRLREVQIQIQDEIARILKELSEYLARFKTEFVNADQALMESDFTFAGSKFNSRISGAIANFSEDGKINLIDLKHPLLSLQGIKVIPNTVSLNPDRRILLLSGPNAGGKTILLKSIGMACQMARSGLPIVGGEGSSIPFFENLDPIIGDLQSVDQNLSSFSSHIARLTKATKYKGRKTLLLVDEICGATDPEEGAALARSFIESFAENEVYVVVTSHLGPLKENWPKEMPLEHGSLEFDNKTNRPTFQLLLGFPGRSLALSVAARLGVPEKIIARARNFLTPDSRKRTEELEEIENFKAHIIDLKKQIEADRDEAKKQKDQYTDLVRKFREQRDRWLEKALQKAEKKIENLIEDARLDRLKNKTLTDIKAELPEIIRAKPSGGGSRPQTIEEFKKQFIPGTPAYSTRLGRQVLVQGAPDSKGQVAVLADSMRVQLPWHTLSNINAPTEENAPPTIRRSSAAKATEAFEETRELDLRGKRIDDAVPLLEKWLDDNMRAGLDRLKIIHGFGTEQLKKAIRQYLSKSRYVSEWKAGDTNTGGDGITWVTLAD